MICIIKEGDSLKTLRALKITAVLQIIFCVLCIVSAVCFGIAHYQFLTDSDSWRSTFDIANILIYGWVVNPIAPISFVVCFVLFLIERKQPENRQVIGKKWIWIFVWPVITTIFYFAALLLAIAFTGGV